ncbi:MAG: hypothetical protein KJ720_06675 [Proteobacteria bacterium]|nr:hypothetical protein [Pseudomonadota bacterium]MBU1450613.1 hypothetical protein [Pseudomonadota bacterium]MBU2469192.1 hypothetical protein [Pseudomonadota bacterium]MBU2518694.1 hypothetical protein [Pseudomonadota bacterium]
MLQWDEANRSWLVTIFSLPVVLSLVMVGVKIYAPQAYHNLIQEDSLLENLQFYFYLAAGGMSLWAAVGFRRAGLARHAGAALMLGLVLLVVAVEEISWGERLLGFQAPAFFVQYNVQHEMTLHNLKPVQSCLQVMYMLVGLGLSLGWLVVGKILTRPGLPPVARSLLACFTPPWPLTFYFLPVFLVYSYFVWGHVLLAAVFGGDGFAIGRVIIWRDQEPAELLLALGCLVWAGRLACVHQLSHQAPGRLRTKTEGQKIAIIHGDQPKV